MIDEIYQQAIDKLAHKCTRAIIEALVELGLFSEQEKQGYLQAVDTFFTKRSSNSVLENQQNSTHHTVNGASTVR